MANVLIDNTVLYSIANSIRAKNGSTTTYKPAQMPAAIQALNIATSSGTNTPSSSNIDDMITSADDIDFATEWEG